MVVTTKVVPRPWDMVATNKGKVLAVMELIFRTEGEKQISKYNVRL